jgi:hypothetical protein
MQQRIRLTWVVLVLFFSGLLMQTIMLTGYVFLNKAFSATFCVNTKRPEMKCNGSCAAMKILQLDDKQDQETEPIKLRVESIKFLDQLDEFKIPFLNPFCNLLAVHTNQKFLLTGFFREMDHPPAC